MTHNPLVWPHWRPKQPLHASELYMLEHFLLTGARLASTAGHGVVVAPQVDLDEAEAQVQVHAAEGVTPSGRPVRVSPSDSAPQLVAQAPGADAMHIWIDVGGYGLDRDRKQRLVVAPARREARTSIDPRPDQLYLGHYAVTDGRLHRIGRPIARHLAVFADDADWEAWVQPVAGAVEDLGQQISEQQRQVGGPVRDAMRALYESFRAEWPLLAWPDLVARAQTLRAVQRSRTLRARTTWHAHNVDGERQPTSLAALLHETPTQAEWRTLLLGRNWKGDDVYVRIRILGWALQVEQEDAGQPLPPGRVCARLCSNPEGRAVISVVDPTRGTFQLRHSDDMLRWYHTDIRGILEASGTLELHVSTDRDLRTGAEWDALPIQMT